MIFRLVRQPLTVRRVVLVVAAVSAAAITLGACSGSSAASSTATDAASSAASGGSSGAQTGQGGPAATGSIAAISGTTMQVQSAQAGQVAVTWSASTKFTQPVAASLSSLHAGVCVTAIAPRGTTSSATSFTADTVTVIAAVNGQCSGGRANGQRPSGLPSGQRPSGFPSGGPGRAGRGALASGQVTSVSGSTLVVAARSFGGNGATTDKTVTVDASTKITADASTNASSLKVGRCVTARGTAESSGTIAATSVRISDPTNGQCSAGFGAGSNGG